MIISASRRTDIPAFYSKWFMERIKKGYYIKVNPFNAKQKKLVSLKSEDVDAIVIWTKNPKPMMNDLDYLEELGYNFYFQFTLNDYPKQLEPTLPSLASRISIFKELSDKLGHKRVIWRYDPIICSSITPISFLKERFEYIASELENDTARVVISFVDMYGKIKNKFNRLEKEHGIEFYDLLDEQYQDQLISFCKDLSHIARSKQMDIYSCAEKIDLDEVGIKHGACIDHQLISELFNLPLGVKKDRNQRPECLCAISEEVGTYNTCKFNCAYCYAVQSEKSVLNNTKKHHWQSPLLIGDLDGDEELSEQLRLF